MRWAKMLVGCLLTAAVLSAPLPAGASAGPALIDVDRPGASELSAPADARRWVDVSVATLWTEPAIARPIDAVASANPADPGRWLRGMSLAQRKWLYGHVETQALYGDEVTLLETRGSWSKVAVNSQPTPRTTGGYPGWIPTVQLTDQAPADASLTATVKRPSTRLYLDAALTKPVLVVSYGTDLPVQAAEGSTVEVLDLDGRQLFAKRGSVRVAATGAPPRPATGAALGAEARKFLGVKYLWGGTSGFGYDCSGLTHAVHQQLGITIPRDAGPQFQAGVRVTRAALQAGDLVFFRNATGIHHVGMYLGRGRMIHAPRTGRPVQIVSLRAQPWAREFAGGRRYSN